MPVTRLRLILGWIKEFFWFLIVLCHLPFSLIPFALKRTGTRPETIVLLPDVLCNPLLYFRLRSAVASLGFSVYSAPVFNPLRGLRDQARLLADRLAEQGIQNGILVGHGMGALCGLALPDSGRRRFVHLVSIGTPFTGSRLFLPFIAFPALRDMAAGSEFLLLNRLNALLFPQFSPFCAYSDETIIPSTLERFGQGRDLIFDQVGHFNLVLGGENIKTLVDFLAERHPIPKQALDSAPAAPTMIPAPPKSAERPRTAKKRAKASPPRRKKTTVPSKPKSKAGKGRGTRR